MGGKPYKKPDAVLVTMELLSPIDSSSTPIIRAITQTITIENDLVQVVICIIDSYKVVSVEALS